MNKALIIVTQDGSTPYKNLWTNFCSASKSIIENDRAKYIFKEDTHIIFFKQGEINTPDAIQRTINNGYSTHYDLISLFFHEGSINPGTINISKIITLQPFIHEDREEWRHIKSLIKSIESSTNIDKELKYFFIPQATIRDIYIKMFSLLLDLKGVEESESNMIAYMLDLLQDSARFKTIKKNVVGLLKDTTVSEKIIVLTKPIIDSCEVLLSLNSVELSSKEAVKEKVKEINIFFGDEGISTYCLKLPEKLISIYES